VLAVTVAVPSHNRPLRLLWLLNALEEQDLDPARWEVVVAHDSDDPDTEKLLADHPLATDGRLRHIRLQGGPASPGRNRNAAWRAGRAPLVAFVDDDCRPQPGWLRELLAAAQDAPGQVVQGATTPDPFEDHLLGPVRHARSLRVEPPNVYAQTANILYPRSHLERAGGFDETMSAGEDTDLFLRVRDATGAGLAPAPAAIVHHAVEPMGLLRRLRHARRWGDLALVVKRHPEMRRELWLGVFWRRSHAALLVAAGGLALARRHPLLAAAVVPWVLDGLVLRSRGSAARSLARSPERLAVDAVEMAVLARGSVRHRTTLL
jgi:glycosyltransferase involved in cell wall biosynthesis